jgi:hypothetical protein
MKTELAIRQLQQALDRLALPPEKQIAHIARLGVEPDELALEFDDMFRITSGMIKERRLPESLKASLDPIDALLQEMTRSPEGKWSRDAVLNSEEWRELRELAQNSLTILNAVPFYDDAENQDS